VRVHRAGTGPHCPGRVRRLEPHGEAYGDRLAFVGGLDARILESGDRDLIRKGVTDLMEGMKRLGASYVFGSDHSISTLVTYDAFRFALEVYREHMAYD